MSNVIYITKKPWDVIGNSILIYCEEPFSKVILREAMRAGKNIIMNNLTPEIDQIIKYNNGYLEHKYQVKKI